MGRGYLVVEGHGDGQAALNLVVRLWDDLGLPALHWVEPIRGKNLHQERSVQKACPLVRTKTDVNGLLLLRDEDDACPKEFLRSLSLPQFPPGSEVAPWPWAMTPRRPRQEIMGSRMADAFGERVRSL